MKRRTLFVLTVLFLVSGCSGVSPQPDAKPSVSFAVEPNHAKVFFYAAYANPDDRPYFDETYIFHSDEEDFGDITADQFLETDMQSGNHTFSVDQISWSGNSAQHSSLKLSIEPGIPAFIAEEVMPDGKVVLSRVDVTRGEQDILARTRKCVCRSELQRLFDSF